MADQPLSPATDRRLGGPLPHQLANQTRGHLSAIKSLTFKRCRSNVSCGISSRFQLLSPSERQVAHTLLTRPPLSHLSKLKCFVRLACVRHAASVHPEPGSNSQYIVSQQLPLLKSLLKLSSSQKNFIVISDFKEPFSGAYLA